MTGHESAGDLRVVVWMRDLSPPPGDPRAEVLSRLHELEAAGIVDDVSVRIWGKDIAASNDVANDDGRLVRERIANFQKWAERNDHSLEPAFRWYERSSLVSEERHEVIRLPLQCLVVYKDDCLVGVFPCSTTNGANTVADCLQRLEAGDFDSQANGE